MEHPLGKVLASGNGKGNRAIYAHWISTVLAVVLLVMVYGLLSNVLQNKSDTQRRYADNVRNLPGYEEQVQRYDEQADELAWYAAFAFWLLGDCMTCTVMCGSGVWTGVKTILAVL